MYDDNKTVELYFIMIIKSCTFDCHGANILVFRESSNLLSWKESVFNQFCISPLHPPLCVFAYLSATQCLSDGNAKLIYRQRKAYLSATQCLSIGNAKLICRQRKAYLSAKQSLSIGNAIVLHQPCILWYQKEQRLRKEFFYGHVSCLSEKTCNFAHYI